MRYLIILLLLLNDSYAQDQENNIANNFYKINKTLPDIAFYNAQGEKCILDQFNGKIVILNFWATWCTNCLKEIKLLDELQKQFMKLPVKIIPISIDFKDIEAIDNYYKSKDIRYLSLFRDEKRSLYNEFSSHGMPISVIINERGEMLGYFKGNVDWNNEKIKNWLISLTKDIKFEYLEDEDSKQILEKKIQ